MRRNSLIVASSIALLSLGACSSRMDARSDVRDRSVLRSLALLALNAPTSTLPSDGSSGASSRRNSAAACASADLLLRLHRTEGATGQRPLLLELRNTGPEACRLRGYPAVELGTRSGRVLPFRYRDAGDQIVTSKRPRRVVVPPASSAYALIDKYRCDLKDRSTVSEIDVVPRRGQPDLRRVVPRDAALGFCGKGDPGSIVFVSPFERTRRQTFEHV